MIGELEKVNELTRIAYNRTAGIYHDLFKDELAKKEYDRKLLDRYAQYFSMNSKVYDMGCGPSGHIARYLHDKGLHVIGVDISEKCVELASTVNPGMKFLRMDISNLHLEDHSIDGIISYYSLIHTPKRLVTKILLEFRRVLKDGGKLLVAVKKGEEEGFLEEFLGQDTKIYFSNFTKDEIEKLLIDARFKIDLLEERDPYREEISVSRIFCIGEKEP
jgi:ubiquinone/menaquinone biosynthesis C-methylase UbiE